jgi:regulator of CtrA degradation
MNDMTTSSHAVATTDRILGFARSSQFERTFREGMALVEETAAYLDGPGRAASKRLPRLIALAYAGESMRLTTRLMQVASWLLVQRAIREGEIPAMEGASDRYRLSLRESDAAALLPGSEELPEGLKDLMARGHALFERVRRLDAEVFNAAEEPSGNPVSAQLDRLRAAFGSE